MYKVNIPSLARQLLPPILRSPQMMAIVDAMVSGVKRVQALFYEMRREHIDALRSNAHVIVLEHALNKALCLSQNPIYITTIADLGECIMYKTDERRPITLGRITESYRRTILMNGDVTPLPHITINIPDTIATSTDATKDLYQGRYLSMVRQLCDKYLPAGKQYNINIYKYA